MLTTANCEMRMTFLARNVEAAVVILDKFDKMK